MFNGAFIYLFIVGTLAALSYSIINPCITGYAKTELGHSHMLCGALAGTFFAAAFLARPFCGMATDKYDKRRGYLASCALLAASAIGCFATQNTAVLFLCRMLGGFGFALGGVVSTAIGSTLVPQANLAQGLGVLSLTVIVASAAGPHLGLLLIEKIGYPLTFLSAAALAGVCGGMTFFIKCEKTQKKRSDNDVERATAQHVLAQHALAKTAKQVALPAADVTPALTQTEKQAGLPAANTEPALAHALAQTAKQAGLPPQLAPHKSVFAAKKKFALKHLIEAKAVPYAVLSFCYSLLAGFVVSFMLIMGEARGIKGGAMYFTINAACVAGVRLFSGKAVDKNGLNTIMYPTLAATALAAVLLSFAGGFITLAAAAALTAYGQGAALPALQTYALKTTSEQRAGVAGATCFMGTDIGQGLGPVIGGALLGANLKLPFMKDSFAIMYLLCAAVLVCGAVYYKKIRGKGSDDENAPAEALTY